MSSSESKKSSSNHPKRFSSQLRSSSLGEESDDDHFHETQTQSGNKKDDASQPLFSVGVIADIQYAPIPDGHSFSGIPRYYRHSLEVARHASLHFAAKEVDMMLNLGDTIDGKCQEIVMHGGDPVPEGVDPGHFSLEHVMDALSHYRGPVIHTYGNHCLYNLDRSTLAERLGIDFVQEPCGDLVGYFSRVHKGFRFVVLDSYDVSIMQRCETTSQKRKEAEDILRQNNPNFEGGNMNSPEGLEDLQKRFVGFNGGVGRVQLSWLRQTLEEARKANEKVIVLSHQPILPDSSSSVCLIWNYEEVLAALRDYSDVVTASFSGHAHKGGYLRDEQSGIHFRVIEAALENKPERTFAVLDIHEDQLIVHGFGNCKSAVYDFAHLSATANKSFA